jgi:hypothetical protein
MRRAAIEEQNRFLLQRQRQFRMAADVVADALAAFAEVQSITVIGSVAGPLWKEVPRFRAFTGKWCTDKAHRLLRYDACQPNLLLASP